MVHHKLQIFIAPNNLFPSKTKRNKNVANEQVNFIPKTFSAFDLSNNVISLKKMPSVRWSQPTFDANSSTELRHVTPKLQ